MFDFQRAHSDNDVDTGPLYVSKSPSRINATSDQLLQSS